MKLKVVKNIVSLILTVSFISVFAYACKDTVGPNDNDIPAKNVSYSRHIQPIFNYKCTLSGCHDDATKAGGLSLTNYASTTEDIQIVFPYHPENSILVWAIEGAGGYGPMPPVTAPAPPVTKKELQGIKTWIKEGAKAN